MDIIGTWNVTITTPIGTQATVLEFTQHEGVLEGIAKGNAEIVPLTDLMRNGNQLTWKQSITKPMRLNLTFEVSIEGDTLSGTSKAGMLPTSKVTGMRVL